VRPWLLSLLCLAGCQGERPPEQQQTASAEALLPAAPACEPRTFEGSTFTICRFDASREKLELIDGGDLRSLPALEARLGPRAARVKFAMNAGMYDEEGRPIGHFIADGKTLKRLNLRSGSGNFHLLPNGVFAQDEKGRVSVTSSERFEKTVPNPRWATQSGPMLVIDGKLHPKFDEDGPSKLIRNGVGVAGPNTAWFAISEEPVSFGRFARLFRDALGCRNALYLDGTVSSLWDPAGQRQDGYSELGPMIVVYKAER
jgi:uncharacterized protein YigE (DUF2233 family)